MKSNESLTTKVQLQRFSVVNGKTCIFIQIIRKFKAGYFLIDYRDISTGQPPSAQCDQW